MLYDANLFPCFCRGVREREKVFMYELLQKKLDGTALQRIIYECLLQWFSSNKKGQSLRCDDEVKKEVLEKEIFLIDKFMIYELCFWGFVATSINKNFTRRNLKEVGKFQKHFKIFLKTL